MDKAVPWDRLCALIEPFYPKLGNGRRPLGLERVPRWRAGAMVTRDVPADTITTGNLARIVKHSNEILPANNNDSQQQ